MTIQTIPLTDLKLVAFACVEYAEGDYGGGADCTYEIFDQVAFERFAGAEACRRCDCCGHQLKYACVVEHVPTHTLYSVGRSCAKSIECLRSYSSLIEGASLRVAQEAICNAREKDFRANQSSDAILAYEWGLTGLNRTAADIAGKVRSYWVSAAQVRFLISLHQNDIILRETATGTAPVGKHTVTGEIISAKSVENDFGTFVKVLVKLGTGAKVYGNAPSSASPEKGQNVQFTASFEVSKDPLFGFWKRPRNWTTI